MTIRRPRLRSRVTLAFALLGGVLSVLFAAATVYVTEAYEHILVDEILRGQAEDYSLRLGTHPDTPLPQTHRLSGYLRRNDGSGLVPDEIVRLGPGIHETEDEAEHGIHIGVFDIPGGRLYFVIDLSDIERLERLLAGFLLAVVVIGTGLSGWLGWILAGMTIAPVRRLAEAVDALPTQPQVTRLAATVGTDELGRLAQAIDRYQARLAEADKTERQFFGDASHELRTPVAVVRGAVELLLDDPPEDAATRRRLRRLDRGVRELAELLDVLLDLVRQRELRVAPVDAHRLLKASVEPWSGESGPRQLWIDVDAAGDLILPQREGALVLRGVLRRILPPDPVGRLSLRARAARIEIEFVADGDSAGEIESTPAERSDRGLGLTLVGRLAQRIGWSMEERVAGPVRRLVRIHLDAERGPHGPQCNQG